MGIGVSVFLIAVGAVLAFALDVSAEGVDLDTIGVILMVVGGIGLLASLLLFGGWSDRGGDTVVVDRGPRRRVVEEDRYL
jgi:hypothetical protein